MSDLATEQGTKNVEQTPENGPATESNPRQPWLAAVLSLLGGPIGQVYAGRFRRAMVLWLGGIIYLVLVSLAFVSLPIRGLGAPLAVFGGSLAYLLILSVDAFWVARQERDAPLKPYQRVSTYALLFLLFAVGQNLCALVTRTLVAEAFMVPSWSMYPAIDPGDQFLVDKLCYGPTAMQRGDLVAYYSEGSGSPTLLMRLVGLPGDTVEIRDEKVFVNGEPWNDEHRFIDENVPLADELANYGPLKVPDDSFFVLGDNRRRAKDSRTNGPVPLADLLGRANLIYWSRDVVYNDVDVPLTHQTGPIRWDRVGKRLD